MRRMTIRILHVGVIANHISIAFLLTITRYRQTFLENADEAMSSSTVILSGKPTEHSL